MTTYLFEYHHDGASWMFEMPADSQEDAEARVRKLPHARCIGTLQFKVPANVGWLAMAWCWLANAARGTAR